MIDAHCWHWLVLAVDDRACPLRTPTLATNGCNGVDARTVILRAVDAPIRELVCFSDARAGKVKAIMHDPRVAWVFYDPAARIQLRLHGRATAHQDDSLAARCWQQVPEHARDDYLGPQPPGVVVNATRAGVEDAQQPQFSVIRVRIERLDVLFLRRGGHRRAGFDYDPRGGLIGAQELQP